MDVCYAALVTLKSTVGVLGLILWWVGLWQLGEADLFGEESDDFGLVEWSGFLAVPVLIPLRRHT